MPHALEIYVIVGSPPPPLSPILLYIVNTDNSGSAVKPTASWTEVQSKLRVPLNPVLFIAVLIAINLRSVTFFL